MKTCRTRKESLKRALCILAACGVLIGVIEVAWQQRSSFVDQEFQKAFADEEEKYSLVEWAQKEDLFNDTRISDSAPPKIIPPKDSINVPESFTEEIFDLTAYEEVWVAEEGAVVGFWTQEASIKSQIEKSLSEKNWVLAPSSPSLSSFVRTEGLYRWLLVQYTEVNGGTSIVFQYQ